MQSVLSISSSWADCVDLSIRLCHLETDNAILKQTMQSVLSISSSWAGLCRSFYQAMPSWNRQCHLETDNAVCAVHLILLSRLCWSFYQAMPSLNRQCSLCCPSHPPKQTVSIFLSGYAILKQTMQSVLSISSSWADCVDLSIRLCHLETDNAACTVHAHPPKQTAVDFCQCFLLSLIQGNYLCGELSLRVIWILQFACGYVSRKYFPLQ